MRAEIEAELHGNLLPFWRHRSLDADGGFMAEMANDGSVRNGAGMGLILITRLLWTFAALYRRLGGAGRGGTTDLGIHPSSNRRSEWR